MDAATGATFRESAKRATEAFRLLSRVLHESPDIPFHVGAFSGYGTRDHLIAMHGFSAGSAPAAFDSARRVHRAEHYVMRARLGSPGPASPSDR